MIFKKNTEMEFIETDENSLVVFDPSSGDTCILDDIGVSILRAMGDASDLDTITKLLSEEYGAPLEEIKQDTEEFLFQLVEKGILLSCE